MSLNKITDNPKICMGKISEYSDTYTCIGSLSKNRVEKSVAEEDYLINPTLFKKKEGGYFIIYVTMINNDYNLKEWFTFVTTPKEMKYLISKLKSVYKFNVFSLFTFAKTHNNNIPSKYFKKEYKHGNLLNILSDKAFFSGKNAKISKIPVDDKTVDKIFKALVNILNYKRPKKFDKLIETQIKIKENIGDDYNNDNENIDDNNNDCESDNENYHIGDGYGNIGSYNDSNSDTDDDNIYDIDSDDNNEYESINMNKYFSYNNDCIFIKLKDKYLINNSTKRKLDKDKIESNSKKKKIDNSDELNSSKPRLILLLNECKEKIEKTNQKTKNAVQTIVDKFKKEIENMFLSIEEFKDKKYWDETIFFAEVLAPIFYILTCQLDESFYGYIYDLKSFEKISSTTLMIDATDLSEWSSMYRKEVKLKENLIMKETLDYLNYYEQFDKISEEKFNDKYSIVKFFILWTKWINQFVFYEVFEKTLFSAENNKYGLFNIDCSIMKEQDIINELTWTKVMKTQKIEIDKNSTNFIYLVLAIEQLLKEKFNEMKSIKENQIENEEIIDIWNPNIDF